MRTDHHHCQPFAVPNRGTAVPVAALSSVLGGSEKSAFIIPFLPFEIEPFRPELHADQSTRGDVLCPTKDVSKPTQSVAEAS